MDQVRRQRYLGNREAILIQQHQYKERKRYEWHNGVKSTPEIQRRAEELSFRILAEHGFDDIHRMSFLFPFDYLAKKEGRLYFVEVTTSRLKRMAKQMHSRHPKKRKDFAWRLDHDHIALAEFIGARIAVVFITPSLERYHLLLDPGFGPGKIAYFQSARIHGLLSQIG